MFSFQSCQEATTPELNNPNTETDAAINRVSSFKVTKAENMTLKEKEELTNVIKNIANGLALLLKDTDNKEVIELAIKNSTKREQILEATELLNTNYNLKVNGSKQNITFKEAIFNVLPPTKKEIFNAKINDLPFGLIDILLPSKEYRKNWNYRENIQVAAVGWNEKIKDTEVTIFTTDGNKFIYTNKQKPEITTLVVTASEKHGDYYEQNNTINKNREMPKTSVTMYEFWTGGAEVNGYYDNWWDPVMEVYFMYKIRNAATNWNWTGWKRQYQSGTRDCEYQVWRNFTIKVMGTGHYNYQLKIKMVDEDFWSSDDDIVDGTTWRFSDYPNSQIYYFYHQDSQPGNWVDIYHDDEEDTETVYDTRTN